MSMETIISMSNPLLVLIFLLELIFIFIFLRSYKKIQTVSAQQMETIVQQTLLLNELKKEQRVFSEMTEKMLQTVEKIAASTRQESKHQKDVREKLEEIREEVIEQSLSKMKMDEGLRKLLTG
ncbi:hypothetical protein N8156_01440 [Rhodospirillaceae bacterium]|nr:hypothetical protein [Rhodospirillaceae bacterium]